MAICGVCNREMLKARGCAYPYIKFGESEKLYKRERVHDGDVAETGKCFDCGAQEGGLHHDGCDIERCPKCGGQAIGCDCTDNVASYLVKKTLTKINP